MRQVFSKTPKGLREATGKANDLDSELLEVLKACKDNQTADEIAAVWPEAANEAIIWAVGELVKAGYLREVFVPRSDKVDAVAAADDGMDLNFASIDVAPTLAARPSSVAAPVKPESKPEPKPEPKPVEQPLGEEATDAGVSGVLADRLRSGIAARRDQRDRQAQDYVKQTEEERNSAEVAHKARQDAEEKARCEAEDTARRAAVEKIRREALEKFRREEDEKARREAEENARRETEEKARIESAEKARIEAEERVRREAEEKLRREAEEEARREAEEKARIEAEERARIEAEERARREAEEKLRREAEEKARRKAEEKARKEAEERARLEEEERDRESIRQRMLERKEVRKRQSRIAAIAFTIVLPFLALFLVKFLPFDGKRQAFETTAASALGVSVKAGSAHVELVPKTKLILEDVVFGDAGDGVRVKRVVLGAPLSVLWQMPAEFNSLHLDDARLPVPVLMNLLATGAGKLPLKVGPFTASRLILAAEPAFLPPLEVEVKMAEGRMTEFVAQAAGAESGKVKLDGVRGPDAWNLSLNAERFDLPFATKLQLVDFAATGQLSPERLTISVFKGWLNNGELGGSGTLTWQGNWKLGGKFSATRVNASSAAPGWFKDGVFEAQGDIFGVAAKSQDLLPMAQIQAQIGMSRGVLAGIDFDRVLQGRGQGEQFTFDSLKANLLYDGGRIEASQIRLTAGALVATGAVAIAPDQTVRGRISIEVKSASSRQNASLSIGGTATKPEYQR